MIKNEHIMQFKDETSTARNIYKIKAIRTKIHKIGLSWFAQMKVLTNTSSRRQSSQNITVAANAMATVTMVPIGPTKNPNA